MQSSFRAGVSSQSVALQRAASLLDIRTEGLEDQGLRFLHSARVAKGLKTPQGVRNARPKRKNPKEHERQKGAKARTAP